MSKSLSLNFTLNFADNRLQLEAAGTFYGMPFHGVQPKEDDAKFEVFRHYPLSELEARSLHFRGSNPIHWVEEHMVDLVLLLGFEQGYDLRSADASFRYVPSFIQTEEGASANGELTPQEAHIYQWSHNREEDVLYLSDNEIEIGRFPVRGPQNYLQLSEFQADIESRAVRAQESEGPVDD